jgi:uncharacterized membrane protein
MTANNFKPLIRAGIFLGIGMGGFVDGILFHQILQFHGMLTAKLPKTTLVNLQVNMFWDGMFHVLTWITTLAGLILLWKAVQKPQAALSSKCIMGSAILGWGLFNLIEGIIDHHILGLHHVVESLGVSIYDYAFLASGVIMIGIGWSLVRASKKQDPTRF